MSARDDLLATLMEAASDPGLALDMEDGNARPLVEAVVDRLMAGRWLVAYGAVRKVFEASPEDVSGDLDLFYVWAHRESGDA